MIISNATPLIAFSRINRLDILHKVVNELIIPEAVAKEISEYPSTDYGTIDLKREHWISIHKIQSHSQVDILLATLDRGEAEVIILALERAAKLILIDELTGRKVAESLQLTVSGSIGILIRAKQKGIISLVKPLIDDMLRCGIHYSKKFIDSVLYHVGE